MYHRSKFELDPTSIKHFSRPRKVQAQYSAYIVNYAIRSPISKNIWNCSIYSSIYCIVQMTHA